jgi:hypothetical protein
MGLGAKHSGPAIRIIRPRLKNLGSQAANRGTGNRVSDAAPGSISARCAFDVARLYAAQPAAFSQAFQPISRRALRLVATLKHLIPALCHWERCHYSAMVNGAILKLSIGFDCTIDPQPAFFDFSCSSYAAFPRYGSAHLMQHAGA